MSVRLLLHPGQQTHAEKRSWNDSWGCVENAERIPSGIKYVQPPGRRQAIANGWQTYRQAPATIAESSGQVTLSDIRKQGIGCGLDQVVDTLETGCATIIRIRHLTGAHVWREIHEQVHFFDVSIGADLAQ